MVQRYDLQEDWVTGHIDLEKDADGDWVSYEDYAKLEAELQKYKDQLRDSSAQIKEMQKDIDELQREVQHKTEALDYLYANQVSQGQSVCRKNDTQECAHEWSRYIVHPYRKICLVCGVKE